ncbi:MAG: fibrobacter succinogenes major paralogous domain-containing protein, partial [Dysgonamonadaceae bacterium]|nr:fibrobacter succinogenes major paralogous domain-containing protein [Dysgonamonadaceae bacterium]
DPKDGALLDLNSTAKGVLLLSNVSLTDLEKIPGGVFVGITNEQDNNTELIGAMVYNTNIKTGRGLYVWTGAQWTRFKIDGNFDPFVPGEVGELKDPRDGETYYTGNFGPAGIWMLENLRYVPKAEEGYEHNGTSNSTDIEDKYYAYPGATGSYNTGTAETGWDKSWGVLYNWPGATNGRNTSDNEGDKDYITDKHPRIQGICPDDWHLPSDMEGSDLEEVIANDAGVLYSTAGAADWDDEWRTVDNGYRGTHGKKMKTNGTSKPADEGGFAALLVGRVLNSNRSSWGSTYFWASSSGTTAQAWYRDLTSSNEGVYRYRLGYKSGLHSVRCKKD